MPDIGLSKLGHRLPTFLRLLLTSRPAHSPSSHRSIAVRILRRSSTAKGSTRSSGGSSSRAFQAASCIPSRWKPSARSICSAKFTDKAEDGDEERGAKQPREEAGCEYTPHLRKLIGRVKASRNRELIWTRAVGGAPLVSRIRLAIKMTHKWIATEKRSHATQPSRWLVLWRADVIGESKDPIRIRNGTGECEIFAAAYRTLGLATVGHPVAQVTGRVSPRKGSG